MVVCQYSGGKMDSSHKYVAFLVCNATWRPEFLGNSLKLRCHFGVMEPESNRSLSEKMSKRAEMPFDEGKWEI